MMEHTDQVAPEAISEERLLAEQIVGDVFPSMDSYCAVRYIAQIEERLFGYTRAARQKIVELEAAFQEQLQIGHNLALLKMERDERIASLEQQLAALKASRAELMAFSIEHHASCQVGLGPGRQCDCGLDAALARAREVQK